MDGTLIHLPINYEILFKEFRRIMKISKVKPLVQTIKTLDHKTQRKVDRVWTEAELEALPSLRTNRKGMKLYQKFSGKPLALVTMQGRRVVEEIVRTLKLSFDVIITREDSLDRAKQIETAIAKLSLKPENILMIGDRESDKASSEKVGCQFLLVMK